jgi:hypothetical protein
MLGFRWEKHTTTTCLSSGGKTDKLKKTCLSSGGKITQAITWAINYISVNMYTWNFTIFLVKGEETIIVCAIYKSSCKNKNIYWPNHMAQNHTYNHKKNMCAHT